MMKKKLQEVLKKQDDFYYNKVCNEIFINNSSISEFHNYHYDRIFIDIKIIVDKFKNKESFYFCKNLENENGFFNYINDKKIFSDIVINYSGNDKYTISIDKDKFYKIKCYLEKNKILKEVKNEEKTIVKKRRL